MATNDAALVAELRRLASEQGEHGTCDCDGAGDCNACWTMKGVRLLDLAEEALRLRDVPHAKCINLLEEQQLVNESLRAEVERLRAAVDSIGMCVATHPRDWGLDHRDAWIFEVACGWGELLPVIAQQHGWGAEAVTRLRSFRAALDAVKEKP